jgi:hypothetical protein
LNIYFERRWVEEEDLKKKKPTSLQPKTWGLVKLDNFLRDFWFTFCLTLI